MSNRYKIRAGSQEKFTALLETLEQKKYVPDVVSHHRLMVSVSSLKSQDFLDLQRSGYTVLPDHNWGGPDARPS